jgi:hypothetical protein
VLDVSGSMGAEDKIGQLKAAARSAVAELGEGDRLHLTLFSTTARSPWSGLRPVDEATRALALETIDEAAASGGTGIESGLRSGLTSFTPDLERVPVMLFLTDGVATSGVTQPAELRRLALEMNEADARLFGSAFGSDADWSLVAGLARDGGGTALRVLSGAGADADLGRFMRLVTAPALRDVQVTYPEGATLLGAGTDILFAGSELLVVGTLHGTPDALLARVTATGADGPFARELRVPVTSTGDAHVQRMVVFRQIRDLQQRIAAEGASTELVQQVVALGVAHGFVTDHTSLVLTIDTRAPNPPGGMPGSPAWSGTPTVTPSAWPTMMPTTMPTSSPMVSPTTAPTPVVAPGDGDDEEGPTPGPGAAIVAAAFALAALARRRRA